MRSGAVILCGVVVVVLAGCGGSSPKANSSTPSSTPSSPAASKPLSGIKGRLLTDNELHGFTGTPDSPATSVSRWVAEFYSGESPSQQAADAKHLTRLGFVAGDNDDLNDGNGLSSVEQFKTAQEAQAEVNYEAAQFSKEVAGQGKVILFSVPGIPGARGYAVASGASGGGANISFAKGPYAYVAGQEVPSDETIDAAKAALIAAARHEYGRVTP